MITFSKNLVFISPLSIDGVPTQTKAISEDSKASSGSLEVRILPALIFLFKMLDKFGSEGNAEASFIASNFSATTSMPITLCPSSDKQARLVAPT